ncbi:enoyl-CoA hydratase/isomerase family protein [Enteractinococcus coprophilus]|uniref:3-hydroxyisobutyryl-CoA hydrolase n=1 Tax=Enteractinococcus coprophilus TaxID=1027633 RepID=A0A543AF39_9MICC|nr:enoyl-CoA hydratase/isomerase family protein [Enteractinococcus coprophilus]TQL71197.1 enoyl-CoA hydratase [Enteractinococcus coprophilus]
MSQPEILTSIQGRLGVITLNRPKAVNALSYNMIGLLDDALTKFEHDDAVHAVLIRGAGARGFCSGGDVVTLHQYAVNNDLDSAAPFFRDEYQLDHRISIYPKPYIAIMHGLVLGGGVGISAPASHRVVTDSTRFGMPEVGIGFSPDVGGPYYLANAPAGIGNYLGLTGAHISGADAVYAGLAEVRVPDDRIEALVQQLESIKEPGQIDEILAAFDTPAPSELAREAAWIQDVFCADTVEDILTGVQHVADQGHDVAQKALKAMQRHSPVGMKVTLEAIRRARHLSLAETLAQDLRTTMNAVAGTELAEGIRAQLIDKDRNPQWTPARLEDVTHEDVEAFFAPVDGVEDLVIQA